MKNKKYLSLILVLFLMTFLLFCAEEEQDIGFVNIEDDIDYFSRINKIFMTNYDIMESVDEIKKHGSDLYVYENETMALKVIVQFGGFTKEERRQINLNNHITGVRLGYIVKPEKLISISSQIDLLIRLKKDTRMVVGWKFILNREKGEEVINAIEKQYGEAGIAHDAFGWQSEKNRYLYTIYPDDITFTIISNDFMDNLRDVLGINENENNEENDDNENNDNKDRDLEIQENE
jgi:hypothetical protein